MQAIAAHTSSLARYLHAQLSSLRHGTGEPVLRFFGQWEKPIPPVAAAAAAMDERFDKFAAAEGGAQEVPAGGQGPVVTMGFLRPGGGGAHGARGSGEVGWP